MAAETTDKLRDRKNRMFNGMSLDSDEEYLFLCWCSEAVDLGLITPPVRPDSFPLSERASYSMRMPSSKNPDRTRDVFLMHPHSYQADFLFFTAVTDDGKGNTVPVLDFLCSGKTGGLKAFMTEGCASGRPACFVDVKGGFAGNRSRNSSDITFPINQKWVYSRYGVFVNKVVISPRKGLFSMYWAPDEAFTTVKGNTSRIYRKCARFKDAAAAVSELKKEKKWK